MKKVITCEFEKHKEEIRMLRWQVFVKEMGIPESTEFADNENDYLHVLAFIDEEAIATGRLDASGHIGRIAVLKAFRKSGFGRRVMRCLEAAAREDGLAEVFLAAQAEVVPFYKKLGYLAEGEVFMEVGIPHQYMRKNILELKM